MKLTSKWDDEELLGKLQQGNKAAFEAVFHRHYKPLCVFAMRYVRSQSIAEELVQDSMFKLWERREEFRSCEGLNAFLYVSTRNGCLDNIKMENRRRQRDVNYCREADEVEEGIEIRIIEAELLAEIHGAIARLPKQCRKIFELSFHERLSGREIAELLNISVSTVNNQKARGLSLLRKQLVWRALFILIGSL